MTLNIDTNQNNIANNTQTSSPILQGKIFINQKTGRIETMINTDDLNNGKYIEFEQNQPIYIDMTKEFSYNNEGSISKIPSQNKTVAMTAIQYQNYKNQNKILQDKYFQGLGKDTTTEKKQESDNIILQATENLVSHAKEIPIIGNLSKTNTIQLSTLIHIVGKDGLQGQYNSYQNNNNSTAIQTSPSNTIQQISAQQSQIDALKALLNEDSSIGHSQLSENTFASVGFIPQENKITADGSKIISLGFSYKPGTLNPYNAYKNKKINKMAAKLNNPSQSTELIEDIMKFTRLRKGGKIVKGVKTSIWKNELKKMSNERLTKEFNKKMELFVESRLGHLKKSSDAKEVAFAQNIEANIRLLFQKVIAQRILDDIKTVVGPNQSSKVIPLNNNYRQVA